jgi:hypothetical protein
MDVSAARANIFEPVGVTFMHSHACLQECTFRKVWEDDGNRQVVEVEQTVQVFFKTMRTRMMVVQVLIMLTRPS